MYEKATFEKSPAPQRRRFYLKTREDEGIVRLPQISPHLQLTFLEPPPGAVAGDGDDPGKLDKRVFLGSEYGDYVLSGDLFFSLASLIDGKTDRRQLVEKLKERGSVMEIKSALSRMAYSFYIVSAEHGIAQDQAAVWASMGVSPRYAEQKLRGFSVRLVALNGRPQAEAWLREGLAAWSVKMTESDTPDLFIVLVDDYLDPALEAFNRARLRDGRPWLPARLVGLQPMFGPVFRSGDEEPCWRCLYHRMKGNREVRSFLGYMAEGGERFVPKVLDEGLLRGHAQLLAMDAARWIVLHEEGRADMIALHRQMRSFSLLMAQMEWHTVMKRPQCPACGDRRLHDPSREFLPVVFRDGGDTLFTSGGMKAREPHQTVELHKDLVSPLSGVVTQLLRSSPPDDPWLHVYWAGSNLALMNAHFNLLTASLRTKSSGKGRSRDQAQASAIGEALERYSGVFHGDEIRKAARFADFGDGEALHPNKIMLFSDKQYAERDEYNRRGHRFGSVPLAFDEEVEMEWSPMWSVTRGRKVWLPTAQLYFSYMGGRFADKFYVAPDSNGAASGNTLEEAAVQGFMELVERDAFAMWWYNELQFPEFDITGFNDPFLSRAPERYRKHYNRDMWVMDITNDFGIPVMVAVSRRTDKEKEDICFSAGAHFDPHIACLRAVCEMNQYLTAVLDATDDPDTYNFMDPECLDWWQNVKLKDKPYLTPLPGANLRGRKDYEAPRRTIYREVRACVDKVHDKGLELLALDQTRPDIGLPVIKLLVPGMRHFWARFAPGRLYDVPVAMGKLKAPKTEDQLNPIPVFI